MYLTDNWLYVIYKDFITVNNNKNPTLASVLRNVELYTKKPLYCSRLISSMTENLLIGICSNPRLTSKSNQREDFHKDLKNTDTLIDSKSWLPTTIK